MDIFGNAIQMCNLAKRLAVLRTWSVNTRFMKCTFYIKDTIFVLYR